MSSEPKTVKLPVGAKAKAEALIATRSIADVKLSAFLDGCMEGLKLEGNWNLNTDLWVFTQILEEPEKEEEQHG